jgi:hypothetical protein
MGKWTEKSKSKAIGMMENGFSNSYIANSVGMSIPSVRLLRYSEHSVNLERISCNICGEEFKQITNRHLKKHGITLKDYKSLYPNSVTITESRQKKYKNFSHPNKGKTYEEIYGYSEAKKKRKLISDKQVGRPAPKLAGTGITGTRRDTNTFARSTYEANIDRVFIFENKKYISELEEENKRFNLKDGENDISYQPDRIDCDGLFHKGAYLEIKGYMFPEDWKKIQLFRSQYPELKLLVISSDLKYADISYNDLKDKYSGKIDLWEEGDKNYKKRPDLYKIGYVEPERVRFLKKNYPNCVNKSIIDSHKLFIAKKCVSSNKSNGKRVNVDSVNLIAITNKRKGANRKSSGVYNYELWEIHTESGDIFFVSNQLKTVDFYCYDESRKEDLLKWFVDNCDMSLSYGEKAVHV